MACIVELELAHYAATALGDKRAPNATLAEPRLRERQTVSCILIIKRTILYMSALGLPNAPWLYEAAREHTR